MDEWMNSNEGRRLGLDDLALAYHVPDKDETLEEVAKQFFAFSGAEDPDHAVETVVEALHQANPGLEGLVPAGKLMIVPLVGGVPPIIACRVPRPSLPDSAPPPDPAPLKNPPIIRTTKVGEAQHVSHPRPGCVYFWEFFEKVGPLQEEEFLIGSKIWVRFEGRTSGGIGPLSVTIMGKYCVLEADHFVVRRWQWMEIWGVFRVLCAEPGDEPARKSGTFLIEAKWVALSDVERFGPERVINCEWSATGEGDMVKFADDYAGGASERTRGADQLP